MRKRAEGRFVAAAVVIALVVAAAPSAGLLAPQTIDAGTGADASGVGASFGARQAWAGFLQNTAGVQRLYVAHAQDGVFAAPQLADGGNAVTAAALAGGGSGDAVVVFTETSGGVGTLYGRRLAGGQPGPVLQISAAGQNAQILSVPQLINRRDVAEDAAGDVGVCYVDQASGDAYAAVLASGASTWARFGPLQSKHCEDIGVDAKGDVVVLDADATDGGAYTDRVVSGSLHGEQVDPNAKDEQSLAVSAGGSALVLARTATSSGSFTGSAWLLKDVAAGGAWQSLGTIDQGTLVANTAVEFARAALAPSGKGILTFQINNAVTGMQSNYVEPVDTSAAAPIGPPQKLGDGSLGHVTPVADDGGDGLALWEDNAAGALHIRDLVPGAPGDDIVLPASSLTRRSDFQADAAGDFLAVVEQGSAPVHLNGVFGDFVPPALAPRAAVKRPLVGRSTRLASGASDAFSAASPSVTWRFPRGSVLGRLSRSGANVVVRFATVGRIAVTIRATDQEGNAGTARLIVTARAHARLRVRPARAHPGGRLALAGTGFAPDKPVTVLLRRSRLARIRVGTAGRFAKRVALRTTLRRGAYVLRACQLGCRVHATAKIRVG